MHFLIDLLMFGLGFWAGKMLRDLDRQLKIDVRDREAQRGIMWLFRFLTFALIIAIGMIFTLLT